jgi:hypothetical protein
MIQNSDANWTYQRAGGHDASPAPAGIVPPLAHAVDDCPPPPPPRAADGPTAAEADTTFGPGTRGRVPRPS